MEVKLRKNGAAEEMLEAYLAVRRDLLELLRQDQKKQTELRAEVNLEGAARTSHEKRKRRAGLRSERSIGYKEAEVDPAGEHSEVMEKEEKEKEMPVSNEKLQQSSVLEENDPFTPCPVCQVRMKRESIPYHIQSCLDAQAEREANGGLPRVPKQYAPPISQRNTRSSSNLSKALLPLGNKVNPITHNTTFNNTGSATTAQTPLPQQNRLPKPNYDVMKEKTLRDKLVELRIPYHGPKAAMRARHTEWVNMYNANLDSLRPKSHLQLVNDLKAWEKSRATTVSGGDSSSSGTKTPGWSDKWSRDHKESYEELVKVAREGVKRRKLGEVGPGTEVKEESGDESGEGGETGNADWVNEVPPENSINSDIGEREEEESKIGDGDVDKDIAPISISLLTPPSMDRAPSQSPPPQPIPPNPPPLSSPSPPQPPQPQPQPQPRPQPPQTPADEQGQEEGPCAFQSSSQNYEQPQNPLLYIDRQSPRPLPPYDHHSTFTTMLTISTPSTASPPHSQVQPQSPQPHPRLPKRTRSQMEI